MRKAHVLLLLALAVLPPPRLMQAQEPCDSTETLARCYSRLSDSLRQKLGTATETSTRLTDSTGDAGEARVAAKSTGIGSLGDGLASTLGDFLPQIAGALGFTQTTTEDGGAAFESNLLLPLGMKPQRFKLLALLRKPSLYEPLTASFPDSLAEPRTSALEKKLRDFDDVHLSVTWNFENSTFGRSFDDSRPLYRAYFSQIVDEVLAQSDAEALLTKAKEDLDLVLATSDQIIDPRRATDQACAGGEDQPDIVPLFCFRQSFRDEVVNRAVSVLGKVENRAAVLQKRLAENGFYEFTDLVNNQPQFNVEAGYDLRRDLAGPDAWSAAIKYEGGFSNVNGLRGFCRSQGIADSTAACLRSYLDSPGKRASIKHGDRFSLEVNFARRERYRLRLPSDSIALNLDGTWDLTGSAGYGRYISFNREGEGIARIDLSGEYIHHQDDSERQNRLVLTGTYTQRISGAFSLSAGFSYSNRPEFVGDVDKKVTANFGLKYKLTSDD